MEYNTTKKMNKLLPAMTWVNLTHNVKCKKPDPKKTCCMFLFMSSPKHKINQTIVFRSDKTLKKSKEELPLKVRMIVIFGEWGFSKSTRGGGAFGQFF